VDTGRPGVPASSSEKQNAHPLAFRRPAFRALLGQPVDRKALFVVLVVFAGASAFRAIHFWVTGFYVPDEFGYVADAIQKLNYYLDRPFFMFVNRFAFGVFGVKGPAGFALLLPFYLCLWYFIMIVSSYKIMKWLNVDPKTVALTLTTSFFIIVPLLLSLAFTTETVALSLAALGSCFLTRYSYKADRLALALPPLAALSFAAALYTREPYQLFMYAGLAAVAFAALAYARERLSVKRLLFASASILLFLIPAYFFLNYPRPVMSETISILRQLIPPGKSSTTTDLSLRLGILSEQYRTFETPPLSSGFRLLNALMIMAIGFVLGWGPIPLLLMVAGLVALVSRCLHKGRTRIEVVVLLFTFTALGTYFGLSFFMAVDPNFISAVNFSTIARLSDEATLAYFLATPFVFAKVRSRRAGALAFASLILFSVAAAPAYAGALETRMCEGYPYCRGQPIWDIIHYRTPLVRLRDFALSYGGAIPVMAEADPRSFFGNMTQDWIYTPGTDGVSNLRFYPYLSWDEFVAKHWSVFVIYGEGDAVGRISDKAPYMLHFIEPESQVASQISQMPYRLLRSEPIYKGSDAFIVLIELIWLA
jgi:hypothetical protein